MKMDEELGEGMKCCICIDYIYKCVTLIDCLHNFCGGCFSDWMKKSSQCPQCRKKVLAVKKNANVNSIIESYLENHPEKKRTLEEYKDMDAKNVIKDDSANLQDLRKEFRKPHAKSKQKAEVAEADNDIEDNYEDDDYSDSYNSDEESSEYQPDGINAFQPVAYNQPKPAALFGAPLAFPLFPLMAQPQP
eukprot:TRINITY_DN3816_c0_g1_i2.p2 TRINITY_DN3816_c0_g1~~TRINITY_DN3816_c0_g1_i2.p2  ORF type:complete len:190 (-),score=43.21 TRINITY_DN3816_c0_g1_i2:629-1198(-)